MDPTSVTAVLRPRVRAELPTAAAGDAWLGGGTWMFSEPQPEVRRLVDLTSLCWAPLRADSDGLSIAATCTVVQLYGFEPPAGWRAASLIADCCRSFLASFKIWNVATIGGNVCLALPAAPMVALCAALDGTCVVWTPDGGERRVPVVDFVRGPRQTVLEPGELLRAVELPAAALRRHAVFRRAALTPLGRSGALLIGTREANGAFVLTVTAATQRPLQLAFPHVPSRGDLAQRLAADIPRGLYHDDTHGRSDWRRRMAEELAEEIREELEEEGR